MIVDTSEEESHGYEKEEGSDDDEGHGLTVGSDEAECPLMRC